MGARGGVGGGEGGGSRDRGGWAGSMCVGVGWGGGADTEEVTTNRMRKQVRGGEHCRTLRGEVCVCVGVCVWGGGGRAGGAGWGGRGGERGEGETEEVTVNGMRKQVRGGGGGRKKKYTHTPAERRWGQGVGGRREGNSNIRDVA